ncbi:hypothetical protein QCA50_007707 [Cerrena zonata]|uniref:NmrA-like domain-containing protein n=1 Tax=Cerrena zonata TaxID=2478898 RepID=A0AAW0G6P4_9APHY
MNDPVIFLLGATGYVGSQFLVFLGQTLSNLSVRALVRSPTKDRETWLQQTHPNLIIIEGSLDDTELIEEQARKADIVINIASCDHISCSILSGLSKRSMDNPKEPPTLLHISGTGILSDNARGEPLVTPKVYSDLDLDLDSLPAENPHLQIDIPIVKAGISKEHHVRTAILFPGFIYGLVIGIYVIEGIQKKPTWARLLLHFAKNTGHVGMWGRGLNTMSIIHVKDVATAIMTVLKALLDDRADVGSEGLYFVGCNEIRPSWLDITSATGDYLYSKGVVSQAGTRPYSDDFIQSFTAGNLSRGVYSDGWHTFGANNWVESDRLTKFGWQPVETRKNNFFDTLKASLEIALQD